MKKLLKKIDIKYPLLAYSPIGKIDYKFINEVHNAGGLGIVDLTYLDNFSDLNKISVPYGVKISTVSKGIKNLLSENKNIHLVIFPQDDSRSILNGIRNTEYGRRIALEIYDIKGIDLATKLGVDFIIPKGNEGGGRVSDLSSFVFINKVLTSSKIPVIAHGGIGEYTAAAAFAMGVSGICLDSVLHPFSECSINQKIKNLILEMDPLDSDLILEQEKPTRVFAKLGTKIVKEIKKSNSKKSIKENINKSYEIDNPVQGLFFLGQDASFAKYFHKKYRNLKDCFDGLFNHVVKSVNNAKKNPPLCKDSKLAKDFRVPFPISQGPMAQVSDTPEFAKVVHESGAFPFMAFANTPLDVVKKMMNDTEMKMGNKNFGAGIIGLDANLERDIHISFLKEFKPKYVIVAAGKVEQAIDLENSGVLTFFHTTTDKLLDLALKSNLKRVIFEGRECGGHIGPLSSFILWELNLEYLSDKKVSDLSILFAGGIINDISGAGVQTLSSDLFERGAKIGVQIGTAYHFTKEIHSSKALSPIWTDLIIKENNTVVVGETVKTSARVINTEAAQNIKKQELKRLQDKLPLTERKVLYEKDNMGGLRAAAKGLQIIPKNIGTKKPLFKKLTKEQQKKLGIYMVGQNIALCDCEITMKKLHEDVVIKSQTVLNKHAFKGSLDSARSETDLARDDSYGSTIVKEEPIAIIGIGARFPHAKNKEEFWQNILNRKNSIREVKDEWDPELYYSPDKSAPGKTYCKIGAFIDDFKFDPLKFKIMPKVAESMDKVQKLALETTFEALNDAGFDPFKDNWNKERTAVVLGNTLGGLLYDLTTMSIAYPAIEKSLTSSAAFKALAKDKQQKILEDLRKNYLDHLPKITEDTMPGELPNVISGRLASVFNLTGANFTVDAACASSMAAIEMAVKGLRSNDYDLAVTGGVDCDMSPNAFVKFAKISAISGKGSFPFDERASGFVMGEGCGIVILKRLSDAIKDKNRIYALVRAVGSSSDGKGKGITAPNPEGQKKAIKRTFEKLEYGPSQVDFLETHGTSTPVGDATEFSVIKEMWGQNKLGISSIKSNIGHLKSAAGAAAIIKTALAIFNKTLPPQINFKKANPKLEIEKTNIFVVTKPEKWDSKGEKRRANISSFGFGGTNFHIALEEHREHRGEHRGHRTFLQQVDFNRLSMYLLKDNFNLILLTGNNEQELLNAHPNTPDLNKDVLICSYYEKDKDQKLELIKSNLKEKGVDGLKALELKKIFYSKKDFRKKLGDKIGFIYPGQGSQYLNMGRKLYEKYDIVKDTFHEANKTMKKLIDRDLTDYIFCDHEMATEKFQKAQDALKQTEITQPAILTLDIALTRLFAEYGIKPSCTLGHSLGEYAALVAGGVLKFSDALLAVSARGREMKKVSISDSGKMATVFAGPSDVEKILKKVKGYVISANKNSTKQTVISGSTKAVLDAVKIFNKKGIKSFEIPVSHAFHSEIVSPASEPLMEVLRKLDIKGAKIPVISNVSSIIYPTTDEKEKIVDILGRQIASPVEFIDNIKKMYELGTRIFIEVGPSKTLATFVENVLEGKDIVSLFTDHKKIDESVKFNETVAELLSLGIKTNFLEKEQAEYSYPVRTESLEVYTKQIVVSGIGVGLPGKNHELFAQDNFDRIMRGENFIDRVSDEGKEAQVDKNIKRLIKKESGDAYFEEIKDAKQVLKLAGICGDYRPVEDYGIDAKILKAWDSTTSMAVCAGFEALKDARIPLVRFYKKTKIGTFIPDYWGLPLDMQDDTGVIFASAFPGYDALIDEINRYFKDKYENSSKRELVKIYEGIITKIKDENAKIELTDWFNKNYSNFKTSKKYEFNAAFLFRVLSFAHAQFAQAIRAKGPNTAINAACASSTQAMGIAEDWIKTRRAKRVIIISADNTTSPNMLPWILSGFLISGAATTKENIAEAALPFDNRREGLIVGSGASAIVMEDIESVKKRGMEPIVEILETKIVNSAFHGSRLHPAHIIETFEKFVSQIEEKYNISREDLAKDGFFMSHETYTPKRGGSASGEILALRETFGKSFDDLVIANTKGFTGHPIGVGIEDVIAIKSLQRGEIPPIANYKEVDPELGVLNLSKGGKCEKKYAIRFGAGFGSQIAMAAMKAVSRKEERIVDRIAYENWLKENANVKKIKFSDENRVYKLVDDISLYTAKVPEVSKETVRPEVKMAAKQGAGSRKHEIKDNILDMIAGKTGYTKDMLDPELDMEADLGIDTIKQAEIFAEIREKFKIERDSNVNLSDYNTIAKVIKFVDEKTGAKCQVSSVKETIVQDDVKEEILDIIAEKTGYTKDMLDPDLDMEADLGIDTIKQAELFAEIREKYNIERDPNISLAEYNTINKVIEFVNHKSKAISAKPDAKIKKQEAKVDKSTEIKLRKVEKMSIGKEEKFDPALLSINGKVLFISYKNNDVYIKLSKKLANQNIQSICWNPEENMDLLKKETIGGVIDLFNFNSNLNERLLYGSNWDDLNKKYILSRFELVKSLSPIFSKEKDHFYFTVLSEENFLDNFSPIAASLTGFTKSLGAEWGNTNVSNLIFDKDVKKEKLTDLILASLTSSNRFRTKYYDKNENLSINITTDITDKKAEEIFMPDKNTVFAVTGGIGGVASKLVKEMAERFSCKFALIDILEPKKDIREFKSLDFEGKKKFKNDLFMKMREKDPKTTPVQLEKEYSLFERTLHLENLLAELKNAKYYTAKTDDFNKLVSTFKNIKEDFGKVDFIIHAAGIEISKDLSRKTSDEFKLVFNGKAYGAHYLVKLAKEYGVKNFIGFSSVAGMYGNLGQIDYSSANDFMNHYVDYMNNFLGIRAISINWSAISSVGMAAKETIKKVLTAAGVEFVPIDFAIETCIEQITSGFGGNIVVSGNIDSFDVDSTKYNYEIRDTRYEIRNLPLIDEILEKDKTYLKAKRTFNVENDLFLLDHEIDGVPYLPGVMGLEMMAEALQSLDPDQKIKEFKNIEFKLPVKIYKGRDLDVFVSVRRTSENIYEAIVSSIFVNAKGERLGGEKEHFKGTLLTGLREIHKTPDKIQTPKSFIISDKEIYKRFFHGDTFKIHGGVYREKGRQMDGIYKRPKGKYFKNREASFVINPLEIEFLFQTCGVYGMYNNDIISLPHSIQRIRIYDIEKIGESLFAKIKKLDSKDKNLTKYNSDLVDNEGNLKISMDDFNMILKGELSDDKKFTK